jgi:hypothetical protein
MEQRAAQLMLQLLNCPSERGLANVALLGSAREVQRTREGDEIPNLLHFHERVPLAVRGVDYLHARNDRRQQTGHAR